MLTLLIFSLFQFSSPPPIQHLDFDSSPMFPRGSSLNDDEDDGFLDVLDDNMEVRPHHLNLLSLGEFR